MAKRRVGLWFLGAWGGVGATTALGLACLRQQLTSSTGLVSELPDFQHLELDDYEHFVVGGYDIRRGSFQESARQLHERARVFTEQQLQACQDQLALWSRQVKPGVILHANEAITALAEDDFVQSAHSNIQAVELIQQDLRTFTSEQKLDQLLVINMASTEPPVESVMIPDRARDLEQSLRKEIQLPTSTLYAWASLDAGFPYINITPSPGASLPALIELSELRQVPVAGQDLKTGETLLKSVLAPMFLQRNLKILSWVGHNILGNRDGLVLSDPDNKKSKVKSKDQLLASLLGYRPQSLVSIEYVESLDDWKTAWDHIHFEGFLGTNMTLQLTWQGCDSLLAAPLVLDLARFVACSQRRHLFGLRPELACFFKSPLGVTEHDFSKQFQMLRAAFSSNT